MSLLRGSTDENVRCVYVFFYSYFPLPSCELVVCRRSMTGQSALVAANVRPHHSPPLPRPRAPATRITHSHAHQGSLRPRPNQWRGGPDTLEEHICPLRTCGVLSRTAGSETRSLRLFPCGADRLPAGFANRNMREVGIIRVITASHLTACVPSPTALRRTAPWHARLTHAIHATVQTTWH